MFYKPKFHNDFQHKKRYYEEIIETAKKFKDAFVNNHGYEPNTLTLSFDDLVRVSEFHSLLKPKPSNSILDMQIQLGTHMGVFYHKLKDEMMFKFEMD